MFITVPMSVFRFLYIWGLHVLHGYLHLWPNSVCEEYALAYVLFDIDLLPGP